MRRRVGTRPSVAATDDDGGDDDDDDVKAPFLLPASHSREQPLNGPVTHAYASVEGPDDDDPPLVTGDEADTAGVVDLPSL